MYFLYSTGLVFSIPKTWELSKFKFLGLGTGLVAAYFIDIKNILGFRKKFISLNTLTHELYHYIAVMLTGGEILHIIVHQDTGSVSHHSSKMNTLVTLSPYLLPFIPGLIFTLSYFASGGFKTTMLFIFGFSYAFYLYRIYKQARPYQDDVKTIGIIWFYSIFLLGNSFFFCLLILKF